MSRILGQILFWLLICFCLWGGGLFWFINQIPNIPSDSAEQTDAIVVLTGGSGRLEYGLELFAQGKGRKLFISGVSQGITLDDLLRHVDPATARSLKPMAGDIALGRRAENTIGNAEETVRWLHKQNFHSIRLVTANYHIPRSLEEFDDVAPDIAVVPAPVIPDDFNLGGWWIDRDSRILLLSEYHKYLAAQLRHFILSFRHGK